mmetsp:Transcript_17337/g.40702  ORF Transcript_17337/g.40702 Transcript_17337/m.40702 type:complete len:344 (-) Transcript_17337:455-1486(-)
MQTRSSPSVSSLHSLAREAGMSSFTDTPKPILYRRLKENYNLNRLQRAHKRGLKRRVDEDMCDFDADLGASSSSSSSSYPDESSPRAMRHAGRSARHDNELEPWDERRGDPDDSRSRKRSRESSKGKGRAGERSRTPPRKAAAKSGYSKPRDAGTKLVDPIMLTELPPGALTFEFQRPNGTGVVYHLNSLIDYFLATGDFTEPETRIEFSDADLKRIDEIAAASQLGKSSVLAAKLNPTRFNDAKLDRDAIVGLERCAGELVADMLKVIESNDPEEGQMRLIMYLFPLFSDLHRQLRTADAEYSSRCMDHFAAYVNGPPNRPTVDKFGFLPIVLSFFRQVRGS